MNQITTLNDNYTDSKIESVNVLLVESMTGAELEYDVLDARIDPTTKIPTIIKPVDCDGIMTEDDLILGCRPYFSVLASDPKQYKYGRAVLYYHDGVLIGKFYMQKCLRVKKHLYSISCVSGIGLLGKSKHYGGLYYTGADTFASVVKDVIGGLVTYTIDETISSQKVYGWLPIATRRENLHQLMFAMGATIKKDENGDMFITVLSSSTTTDIPDSRIYIGGSVEYPERVTKVSVLEHAYLNKGTADEQTTLYEGAVVLPESPFISPKGKSLTGMVVEFSEPMHDLSIDTGSILESGVNYAIVTATGSVALTGYKYTHTTVERFKGDADADEDNTVTVTETTLVSRANSSNVVERLYSYYTSAKTIKMDIVATGERAGDAISFNDPYDDATSGLISELSLSGSNILKGSATIIADYAPTWGNDYTDVIVVTSSQTVTLPADADKCRAVLIGGGHGGGRGSKGGKGETAKGAYGKGGIAGAAGAAGAGGRIIEPVIGENCGGMSFNCVIGNGGKGGDPSNPNGSNGTDSTMSYTKDGKSVKLTTANGSPSFSGFQDFLAPANVYGSYGKEGVAGAKGGGSDGVAGSINYNGKIYSGGTKKNDTSQEINEGDSGYLCYYDQWTSYYPDIFLTVEYYASNGNVTFNVTVDKPSAKYEYTMYVKITLGGSSHTVSLQGDWSTGWTSLSKSCTIIGSGSCTVQMWASGGDRTSAVTMGSGYIEASQPYIRTYHYGYGSGAVVAKNGVNGTDMTGAAGVSATVAGAAATVRGCGGNGGNGGSGGGAGGYSQDSDDGSTRNYAGGDGGDPSNGGDGAAGIIFIYFGRGVK